MDRVGCVIGFPVIKATSTCPLAFARRRVRLTQLRFGRLLPRLFDPTWDGLDEFLEDPASGIVELFNSVDARERYRSLKSHTAGPW